MQGAMQGLQESHFQAQLSPKLPFEHISTAGTPNLCHWAVGTHVQSHTSYDGHTLLKSLDEIETVRSWKPGAKLFYRFATAWYGVGLLVGLFGLLT